MRHLIRFALVPVALILVSPVWACFSPTDHFAAEVVLNKPTADYDLGLLEQAGNVSQVDGALVYRSHFDPHIAVVLSEEPGMPELGFSPGLSVRLQIPTESVEGENGPDLAPAVELDPETFDFAAALREELEWLLAQGIIWGLDEPNLDGIAAVTQVRLAGWNSRLVYSLERWVPYFDSDGPQLLRDGGGCGGFDLAHLPAGSVVIGGPSAEVSKANKLPVRWGVLKLQDRWIAGRQK